MPTETLPANHRLVRVDYKPPPFEQLNGVLFQRASSVWDGRAWQTHKFCAKIDTTPRELCFFMKHFGKLMTDERVITWAEASGYRVANHLETLAYAMANPEDQNRFWYAGLGSFTAHYYSSRVAYLISDGGGRDLDSNSHDGEWPAFNRFLLVRK